MGGEKSLLTQTTSLLVENDNISECSDVEEEGYADFTKDDLEPIISQVEGMQLKPTNNEPVKQLFDDHQQVKQVFLFVFRSLINIFLILWLFIYFLLHFILDLINPFSVVHY